MSDSRWTRRHFLKGLGVAGTVAATGAGLSLWQQEKIARSNPNQPKKDPRFLIVIGASGGASIIDSMMAIRASESQQASTINCFPDQLVQDIPDSPFRAVDQKISRFGPIPVSVDAKQSELVKKLKDDMMVATQTGTSVTHQIGQRRSVTGNEAWLGRTLQECVAMEYGQDFILPNMLLATGTSFIEHGTDKGLPDFCLGETVTNPAVWPLSLDGSRGISSIDPKLIQEMRTLRNETVDPATRFAQVFGQNAHLKRWQLARSAKQRQIENQDLITKLMMYPDSSKFPLTANGLKSSPAAQLVREKFPNFEVDPLDAQAALAFLLLKFRVSVSVTIGPRFDFVNKGSLSGDSILNPPLAFDFSHNAHRATQAHMWERLLKTVDGLRDLLKSEEFKDGESFWDRTMIYVATDFGRSKTRPSNSTTFGSGHDLNNGIVVFSPMVNGNKLLGGVDPNTAMTYGFDPTTGAPDKTRNTEEAQIFAGLLHAMQIDTTGSKLPDMRAMRKNA